MKFEYLTIDWTPEGKYPFFNAFFKLFRITWLGISSC